MKAIIKFMEQKGIKQPKLAEWLGKSQPAISNMLLGKAELPVSEAKIIIGKSDGSLTLDSIYADVPPKRIKTKKKKARQ